MARQRVRAALSIDIRPENRVSGSAFELQPRIDELRFSSLELVVQVDEECSDPLPPAQLVPIGRVRGVHEVEVRPEFLPRRVMQQVRRLELRKWKPYRR